MPKTRLVKSDKPKGAAGMVGSIWQAEDDDTVVMLAAAQPVEGKLQYAFVWFDGATVETPATMDTEADVKKAAERLGLKLVAYPNEVMITVHKL